MKIIRYSTEGFKAQKQTYHTQKFEYWENCHRRKMEEKK